MPDRTTDTASASRARAGRASSTWNRRWTGPWTCSVSAATTAPPLATWRAAPSWRRAACKAFKRQARVVPGSAGPLPRAPRRRHGASHRRRRHRRERLRRLLAFYAESSQGRQGRQGCLVVESAAELSFFDEDVAERVTTALGRNEALLAGLIREGQEDGSLAAYRSGRRGPHAVVPGARHARGRQTPAAGHAGGGHGAQGAGDRPPGGSRRLLPI